MFKKEDIIKSEIIYKSVWLKYHLYSSDCYRLTLDNGLYMLIKEKNDYLSGKLKHSLEVYVEQGHMIYGLYDIKIDKKRLNYITIDEYLESLIKNHKNNNEISSGKGFITGLRKRGLL